MPTFLTAYTWELRKLAYQKRTYLGLGAAIAVPLIFVTALALQSGSPNDVAFGSYVRQSGLAHAVGRTARQLIRELEPHWFERYGRVALTGEPVRFESEAAAMGRWFDVFAFRISRADDRSQDVPRAAFVAESRANSQISAGFPLLG